MISTLPLLLANPGTPATPMLAVALAQTPGTPWLDTVEAFLRLWRRYA